MWLWVRLKIARGFAVARCFCVLCPLWVCARQRELAIPTAHFVAHSGATKSAPRPTRPKSPPEHLLAFRRTTGQQHQMDGVLRKSSPHYRRPLRAIRPDHPTPPGGWRDHGARSLGCRHPRSRERPDGCLHLVRARFALAGDAFAGGSGAVFFAGASCAAAPVRSTPERSIAPVSIASCACPPRMCQLLVVVQSGDVL